MTQTTMLHVRVDEETKTQASAALAAMGLSVSDAVRILLKRVVNDQAVPLELKVPNAQTRAAMLAANSGSQFDPTVVEVFLKIPNELWHELRSEITGQNKRFSSFDIAPVPHPPSS